MSRSGHLLIDTDPVRTALNALVQSTDRLKLFNEEVRTKRPIINLRDDLSWISINYESYFMTFQVINALKIIKISFFQNFGFLAWIQGRPTYSSSPPLLSRDPDIKPRLFRFLTRAREKNLCIFWTEIYFKLRELLFDLIGQKRKSQLFPVVDQVMNPLQLDLLVRVVLLGLFVDLYLHRHQLVRYWPH